MLGPGQENPGGTHITGQLLIVLHELLIFLVDGQYLADAIGCCLRLAVRQRGSGQSPSTGTPSTHLHRPRLHGQSLSHPRSSRRLGSCASFESPSSSLLLTTLCQSMLCPLDQLHEREVLVANWGSRLNWEERLSLRPNMCVGKKLVQ